MSEAPKRYWMTLVERDSPGELSQREWVDDPRTEPAASRRTFLKAAGFSVAGLVAASCGRAPELDALPYLEQPEGFVPGRPYHYASTCGACESRCGILVTNRDGRPIKVDGNPDHPLSGGATCAVGQASLLGLYDSLRLARPTRRGQPVTWEQADEEIN